jgi:tRNA-dihydrouridine synthase
VKLNKINDVLGSNKRVMANEIIKTSDSIEDLFSKVSGLIEQARSYVKTSVNTAEVYTKYYIGKYIVEYEQSGNVRAEYGKRVLKDLSWKLIACFEGGWSVDTLEKCRKLFLVYSKSATVLRNFEKRGKSATRCGFWDNLRMKFQTFFFHGLII